MISPIETSMHSRLPSAMFDDTGLRCYRDMLAVGHVILAEVNLVINQRTERQSDIYIIYIYINNKSTYLLVISAINPFFVG